MHRFIIVGGGAGGLELATRLGNKYGHKARKKSEKPLAQVTLIDQKPTHLWKPLLHEVAAGSMDSFTRELEYAAQARWHGFEFHQGALTALNRATKRVTIGPLFDDGMNEVLPPRELEYDTLVLCIGSTTAFYGVKGAQENCIALDTVEQAVSFRKRMITACMRAEYRAEEMISGQEGGEPRVRIAIIGAGATGVELSAELRNTAEVLRAYGLHRLDPVRDVEIVIIEAGARILPALSERVSAATAELLRQRGIRLITGEAVSEVSEGMIRTSSGKVIMTDLIVWSAGIRAPAVLADMDDLQVNRLGQIIVGQTLQTETDENVFALGDCAACPWSGHDRGVPPRAQAAHQQASFLARALELRLKGKPLPRYTYRDFGSLVSLGHSSAVGSLMGRLVGKNMFVEGLLARFMYASLYRMHIAALQGYPWMVLDMLTDWLRRTIAPRVKLH
jgi:NADH dehydrogenase